MAAKVRLIHEKIESIFADLKMIRTFAPLYSQKPSWKGRIGEVAEWSIAAVLKTVVLRGTRGSNPCLSAGNTDNQLFESTTPDFTPKDVKSGVVVFIQ